MVHLCLVQFYLNESSFTEPFKGTQDTIEEDDGVIFIGNSEHNRLAINTLKDNQVLNSREGKLLSPALHWFMGLHWLTKMI